MSALAPVISAELKKVLRQVKLGRCLDTLPERLALANGAGMGHAEFLERVLADEVTRRETTSAAIRARSAIMNSSRCPNLWEMHMNQVTRFRAYLTPCATRSTCSGRARSH